MGATEAMFVGSRRTILDCMLLEGMAVLVLFAMDLGNLKRQLLLSVPMGGEMTHCSDI